MLAVTITSCDCEKNDKIMNKLLSCARICLMASNVLVLFGHQPELEMKIYCGLNALESIFKMVLLFVITVFIPLNLLQVAVLQIELFKQTLKIVTAFGDPKLCYVKKNLYHPVRVVSNRTTGEGYCLYYLSEVTNHMKMEATCKTNFGGELLHPETIHEYKFLIDKAFGKNWKSAKGQVFFLGYNKSIIEKMDKKVVEKMFSNLTEFIDDDACFVLDYDYTIPKGTFFVL
uniref:Uncharacterized protein n=1 Tax=Syphacia muris TaxID=451379 RepID=A0A0N5AY59_9BILA